MHEEAPQHVVTIGGPLGRWFRTPLFIRITIGLVLGVALGLFLGRHWRGQDLSPRWLLVVTRGFSEVARLTLRVLGALAPALILVAVARSLLTTQIKGRTAGRLIYLLLLNTTVAICIGLLVANVLHPGIAGQLPSEQLELSKVDPLTEFLNSVPESLLAPMVTNNAIGVIILALTFGLAARRLANEKREAVLHAVSIGFDLIVTVLYWVLELVPLAVMCKVAFITTTEGFAPFKSLARFVAAVLIALLLQSCYYMIRLRLLSWVRPFQLLRGAARCPGDGIFHRQLRRHDAADV